MTLILDASMAFAWHFTRVDPTEAALAQDALSQVMAGGAIVPFLWQVEIANAIVTAERRSVSDRMASAHFLADLDALPIELDNSSPRHRRFRTIELARTHGLSAYDATYLELAIRLTLPLATFDRKLAGAARSAGVAIFGEREA